MSLKLFYISRFFRSLYYNMSVAQYKRQPLDTVTQFYAPPQLSMFSLHYWIHFSPLIPHKPKMYVNGAILLVARTYKAGCTV